MIWPMSSTGNHGHWVSSVLSVFVSVFETGLIIRAIMGKLIENGANEYDLIVGQDWNEICAVGDV